MPVGAAPVGTPQGFHRTLPPVIGVGAPLGGAPNVGGTQAAGPPQGTPPPQGPPLPGAIGQSSGGPLGSSWVGTSSPPANDGSDLYTRNELDQIEKSINTIYPMTPCACTAAPKSPLDGMQRLARSPWRPVGGTADVWVYYDLPTTSWKAL